MLEDFLHTMGSKEGAKSNFHINSKTYNTSSATPDIDEGLKIKHDGPDTEGRIQNKL
jgi:hypothetical protein